VLVNTSFNVHEEPIINRPQECLRALLEDRVDFVVTKSAVYVKQA
jgi:carbamoyltransferase